MAGGSGSLIVADLNDVPGGAGGVAGIIAVTIAAIGAGWRLFKTWAPGDANAAANSSAQIAALDRYEKMLEDERGARTADATRAAAELVAVREAWAKDIATRSADLTLERAARMASDTKRDEAMQELWALRGKVQMLTDQVAQLQATVTRLQGDTNGSP